MKPFILTIFSLLMVTHVVAQPSATQSARVIKFDRLKAMLARQNDTTYVYNFWATWCAPCVKEFPSFQKLSEVYADRKLKVIFVSLDFEEDSAKGLVPFLKKHNVKNEVYLLDETDYNAWINQVDSTWDGSLPSTLIVNAASKTHQMYSHDFTYDQLDQAIKPFLQ